MNAIPRRHARLAQYVLEGPADVIDAMGHPRQITMHGDGHDFWPLRGFCIKGFELIHDAAVHLVRRLAYLAVGLPILPVTPMAC